MRMLWRVIAAISILLLLFALANADINTEPNKNLTKKCTPAIDGVGSIDDGGGGSLIMSQCLTSGVTLETGISGSSQESASGSILHSCLEKIPNNGFKTISRAISSEILST